LKKTSRVKSIIKVLNPWKTIATPKGRDLPNFAINLLPSPEAGMVKMALCKNTLTNSIIEQIC
jgi:hypothetical protein